MPTTLRARLDGAVVDATIADDGTVTGSPALRALARFGVGQDVLLTPTGPKVTVAANDAASVVAWLAANTDVVTLGTAPGAPSAAAHVRLGGVS